MGIFLDLVLVLILVISVFAGYKKGLVKLGTELVAGIVAIIITMILYKPVSNFIIRNTSIDGNIRNIIIENMINTEGVNMGQQIPNGLLQSEAGKISEGIIYTTTGIVLFLGIKIILSIVISLLDFVAKLPILKQFNEVGGIIYGLVRGLIIVAIVAIVIEIIISINVENKLSEAVNSSYITKTICENVLPQFTI